MHQVAQYPGPPFDRAALDAVAAHRMDRGHPEESAAWGTFRKAYLAVVITLHAFKLILSSQ